MDKKYVITATIVALLAVVVGAFLLDDSSPHARPGSAPTDPFGSQSSQTPPSPPPSNQPGADLKF